MHDPFHAFCTHIDVKVAGRAEGILQGLTFAAKDNYDIAGYVTGAGNPDWLRTHEPAERTAVAVQMLLDAGATLVGKTQMDELAFSLAGQNAHYGTPINPRTPDRIPGGSSSGSASATAGGLVDFALGTDTGGSVRIPASLCGIFGFRPTHGLISLEGVVPFSPSFDTVGWFARDAPLLRQIGQVFVNRTNTARLGRLIVFDGAFKLATASVSDVLQPVVSRITKRFGAEQHHTIDPEGLESFVQQFNIVRGAEVRQTLGEWIDRVNPRFGPGIRERFDATRSVTDTQVNETQIARNQTRETLDWLLKDNAVFCLPTAPMLAPLLTSSSTEMAHYRTETLKLTSIATVGGLPQVSLPLTEIDGCPVGLSLIAGRGNDALLLDLAVQISDALSIK